GTRFTPPTRCISRVGAYETGTRHSLHDFFCREEVEDMNTGWRVRLMLGWIASQLHWIAHTDTESIYVDEITYRRCLKEHLASQGIEWQTWTQYMQPAEEA